MAVHLLARENALAGYLRDVGLKVMTVAHHDRVVRLGHERVPPQIPDPDRPLPVAYRRLHQLYVVQQLHRRTEILQRTRLFTCGLLPARYLSQLYRTYPNMRTEREAVAVRVQKVQYLRTRQITLGSLRYREIRIAHHLLRQISPEKQRIELSEADSHCFSTDQE